MISEGSNEYITFESLDKENRNVAKNPIKDSLTDPELWRMFNS